MSPRADASTQDVHPTSIKLPRDLLAWLDERRRRQGCTRNFFIVDVLRKFQAWTEANEKNPARKK